MSKLKLWPTTLQACTKTLCAQWMLGIFFLSIGFSSSAADADSRLSNTTTASYLTLSNNTPSEQNEIEIYCWLGSRSCYIFEVAITQWLISHDIPVTHKPLIKRPEWRRLAKARLVAQLLDVENEAVNLIHQHLYQDNLPIRDDDDLFQLFEGTSISASRFANVYYAAETNQAINDIQRLAKDNMVRGIPTIIINNQWLIDASMYRTSRELINTMNQLLGLE